MTDTIIHNDIKLNPDTAAGVSQFLGRVVTELTALQVNGKQAHWHVRGANFQPIHELLDTLVDHAHEWTDTAAERIVALGLPIDARIQTVVRKTQTEKLSAGFQPAETVITEIIAQIDVVLEAVREAVAALGDVDQSSQDVAIEIQRGLEKDRWFFFAHIAA